MNKDTESIKLSMIYNIRTARIIENKLVLLMKQACEMGVDINELQKEIEDELNQGNISVSNDHEAKIIKIR